MEEKEFLAVRVAFGVVTTIGIQLQCTAACATTDILYCVSCYMSKSENVFFLFILQFTI